MEKLLDFVVDNYLWFIIITIVLVFALVGYIIDCKNMKKDNEKKEENETLDNVLKNTDETIKEESAIPALNVEQTVIDTKVENNESTLEIKTESVDNVKENILQGNITLNEQIKKNIIKPNEEEVTPISLGSVETLKEEIEK